MLYNAADAANMKEITQTAATSHQTGKEMQKSKAPKATLNKLNQPLCRCNNTSWQLSYTFSVTGFVPDDVFQLLAAQCCLNYFVNKRDELKRIVGTNLHSQALHVEVD